MTHQWPFLSDLIYHSLSNRPSEKTLVIFGTTAFAQHQLLQKIQDAPY
jgi:hypothetical protein